DRKEESAALMLIDFEITQAQRGRDHKQTRQGLRWLGLSYYEAKQFAKAEEAYLDVLQRDASVGKQESRESLGTQTNLGLLYSETDRIPEAIECTERSLSAKRRVLGPLDPYKASAMNVLIDCYKATGRTTDFQALEKELTQMGAQQLVSKTKDPEELLEIARHLVSQEELHTRSPKLAMEIVDDVDKTSDHAPITQALILEVRALVQFEMGLIDGAIASAEEGLELLPEVANKDFRKRLQDGLERYRAAKQD
ncbi:MAG: tetratricopeptide repeat protein, partial [Planctomycetota bacterium]|nr:tetratricopeptide repeat protein [Planctomycetota bacterium]